MMHKFDVHLTEEAESDLEELRRDRSKKAQTKAVIKVLRFMMENLRHPSLNTHKYDEFTGPDGEEIFESYAQNNTPGAYRVFWFYGPKLKEITILRISPHPK